MLVRYWSKLKLYDDIICHERTKHIEINCHIVRDKITQGLIRTLHVKSQYQLANLLTKALPQPAFHQLLPYKQNLYFV
jgi:hypothetical protein